MPERKLLRGARMIAGRAGCSASTIYAWWQEYDLPAFKANGRTSPLCCWSDELTAWIERKRTAPLKAGEDGR